MNKSEEEIKGLKNAIYEKVMVKQKELESITKELENKEGALKE